MRKIDRKLQEVLDKIVYVPLDVKKRFIANASENAKKEMLGLLKTDLTAKNLELEEFMAQVHELHINVIHIAYRGANGL